MNKDIEKLNDQQLKKELPFDLYGRYAVIRDIINTNREDGEKFKVLDVGGRGNLMKRFLSKDAVFYLDPYVDTNDDNFVEGDGCAMPLKDESYDWVVSADVFEHIPKEKRDDFLKENIRVAKLGTILAAPFDSPEVRKAEINANENYKNFSGGKDHEWLKEHIENGLPNENEIEGYLSDKSLAFQKLHNNRLFLWEILLGINFFIGNNFNENLRKDLENFNLFYNSEIFPYDSIEPSYRKIYFIKKNKTLKNIKIWNKLIDDSSFLDVIKKEIDLVARVDIENKNITQQKESEIQQKDQAIQQKESEIQQKDQAIQQKESEIQEKDQAIQQKESEIQEKEREIEFMKSSKFWKMRELNFKIKFAVFNPLKFIKKYSRKFPHLFGEAINSLKQEGFRRMFSRILNYFLYGKGVLDKKEIISRQKFAAGRLDWNFADKFTSNILPLKTVYYISNIPNGGSRKYLDDLIETFGSVNISFVQIKSREELDAFVIMFKKSDVLLFQYLFYSDLTFEDILRAKKKTGIKLVIPIHDFYFLQKKSSDFYQCHFGIYHSYKGKEPLVSSVFQLLKSADVIIYPSNYVKNIFDSKYVFENAKFSRHIDFSVHDFLNFPPVDKTINIGIINSITVYKGADFYAKLFSVRKYKGYKIQYHIFGMNEIQSPGVIFHGPYVEEEIFSLLKNNKIHGLVFLNKWGETYSYSLTKGLNSGLPILYSYLGAYIERLENKKKCFPIYDIENMEEDFTKMLDFILEEQSSNSENIPKSFKKDIPNLYKNLFSIDYDGILNEKYITNKNNYNALYDIVEPYAIYFPQFHALRENSKTFYEGYHDMINLQQAKKAMPSVIETPLKDYLGYYNLKTDLNVVEKQVLMARSYGFRGFGIYYYWFSQNTVTGNNMLMKEVIDKFFQKELANFDVFFIYANESWSENPAFNQHSNEHLIRNDYAENEIIKNFENLLPYFKHNNYKKIGNKPVFFIHHPWEMDPSVIKQIQKIGDEMMKKNGFAGLELIINGMQKQYKDYKNYYVHPNYKSFSYFTTIDDGIRYIDYKKYVDEYLPSLPYNSQNIQTFFYNFDNIVRYFNHKNKKILITKTKNNSLEHFKKFLNFQLETYNFPDKESKIFLINSWNEWGEQMQMEPSNESGFILLDTFNEVISDFITKNGNQSMRPFMPASTARAPIMFGDELGEKEISVILHLFYPDMWNDIKNKLKNIPYPFTLIVSLTEDHYSDEDIRKIKKFKPNVKIFTFENKGLDILPFLKCLKHVPPTTKYLLKIHSKKSHQHKSEIGIGWFSDLMQHVLPDRKTVDMILQNLEYSDVGMIGGGLVTGFEYAGIFSSKKYYEPQIELVYKYFGTQHTDYEWIAGSMFWVRFDIINKFDDKFIEYVDKHQAPGYLNHSTIVHGLERYFGKLVYDEGKVISPHPIQRYSKNYITLMPEKKITPPKKDIYLFFHICCLGNYEKVTRELVASLIESGLYEKSQKVFYTILGQPNENFIEWLNSLSKFECVYKSPDVGEVEYPELAYLQKFCLKNDAYILYFHTKGVSNSQDINKILWRKHLTKKTIYEYKTCLSFLNKGCDIAGCGWKEHPYNRLVMANYDTWTHSHFSGNFWWANSNYIRSLPDIEKLKSNYRKIGTPDNGKQSDFNVFRILCEMWIGMQNNIKVGINGDLNTEYKKRISQNN